MPSPDQQQILALIRRCVAVNVKRKATLQWLLQLLEHTPNHVIRNQTALAVGDLRVQAAVPILMDLLQADKTKNNRGSLLFALRFLEYRDHLDCIAAQLGSEVYEVVDMALYLLEQVPHNLKARQTRPALQHLQRLLQQATPSVYPEYIDQGIRLLQRATRKIK